MGGPQLADPILRDLDPWDDEYEPYGSPAQTARCPRCDSHLATYIVDIAAVKTDIEIELPSGGTSALRKHSYQGYRVRLSRAFANRGARHPSGLAWYHRGRRPRRDSMRIRVPAAVTCCEVDVLLPSLVTDAHRGAATTTAADRPITDIPVPKATEKNGDKAT